MLTARAGSLSTESDNAAVPGVAQLLAAAPGQAREMQVQFLGQLAERGVEHGPAHPVRQPLRLEGERAEELPALAAEDVQIGAFQATAARGWVRRGGSAARSSRCVCVPTMRPARRRRPP